MKYLINHEYVSIGSQSATHRIILLHGWGADADDLLPLGEEIAKASLLDFEIISLRAPNKHPDNLGRQWYAPFPANWEQAEIEVERLVGTLKLLDKSKINLKKTILLGFSQGAAMSIDAVSGLDLGLLVACSGYPHPSWKPKETYPKTILSHGLEDQIVPYEATKEIYKKLKKITFSECKLFKFKGGHQIDINLLKTLESEIKEIF